MRKIIIYIHVLIVFFVSNSLLCVAQNLVPNPNFREYDNCPLTIGDFSVQDWVAAVSTPDYYNVCGAPSVAVPNNTLGFPPGLSYIVEIAIQLSMS